MTVEELLGRVSSLELSEWLAYYMIEREDEQQVVRQQKTQAQAREMAGKKWPR